MNRHRRAQFISEVEAYLAFWAEVDVDTIERYNAYWKEQDDDE